MQSSDNEMGVNCGLGYCKDAGLLSALCWSRWSLGENEVTQKGFIQKGGDSCIRRWLLCSPPSDCFV